MIIKRNPVILVSSEIMLATVEKLIQKNSQLIEDYLIIKEDYGVGKIKTKKKIKLLL